MNALSAAVGSSLQAFEATDSSVLFEAEQVDELQEALGQFFSAMTQELVPSYPELAPLLTRQTPRSGAGVSWLTSFGLSADDLLTSALLEEVAEESCRDSAQASYSFSAAFAEEDDGDAEVDTDSSRRRLLAAGGGSSGGSSGGGGRGRVRDHTPDTWSE